MSTWSTSGASRGVRRRRAPDPSSRAPDRACREGLGLDVLELLRLGRLGDVAVLGVGESDEDLVEVAILRREPDDVDVGVLAIHEVEVVAVAPHGKAADET